MKFTVIWRPAVLTRLIGHFTETLHQGGDPTPIEKAAARIDTLLESNPLSAGESRGDNKRILFELPLIVDFEVYADEGIVFVTGVRHLPKPPFGA